MGNRITHTETAQIILVAESHQNRSLAQKRDQGQKTMTNPSSPNEPAATTKWESCTPGVLTGYSRKIHRRRFLLTAAKTVGVTGCVAAIGFGGWLEYLRRLEGDYQLAGMTCSEVRELLPAYAAGRLVAARSEVLEKHVRKCENCAKLRPQLRPQTA